MTERTKISELPNAQKITIKLRDDDGATIRRVEAPLPDGFGMSVGSAFSDPQNTDLTDLAGSVGRAAGVVTGGLRAATRSSGFSTKITQRSNVFYDGPEPTEISFELSFNAYYSAYHEVLVPVFNLMMMSVGREYSIAEIDEYLDGPLRTAFNRFRQGGGRDDGAQTVDQEVASMSEDAAGQFGAIRSPGQCKIKFGNVYTIPRAFVSSVGVQFSNVLDNQDIPVSADCSVTIKVIRNPSQGELSEYFSGMGGNR